MGYFPRKSDSCAVKAAIPEEAYQVILTDEQKTKIASGALKLMTKKDGSLMANLINPETKKIVSTVSLGKVKLSPELSQAMTNYATQMQMAQIAEQIQFVQVAVEEVRQGTPCLRRISFLAVHSSVHLSFQALRWIKSCPM